jgi:sec-independent protein translocase protein TatB
LTRVFDISFAELLMVAVVGLLVIGPDKLPQVARTLGAYVGRMQRYVAQVKEEVNREARFEDLQNLQQEIKQGVNKVEASIMAGANEVEDTLAQVELSVKTKRSLATTKETKTSVKRTQVKKSSDKKTPVKKSKVKKSTTKQTKGKV